MLFDIPYAAVEMSPSSIEMLFSRNPLLIMITTMHAAVFIRNGDIPMRSIFFTMLPLSLYMPRCRCNNSFGLLNSFDCHASVMACARIVASAAPRIPMLNTNMKIGVSIAFITTVIMVADIACCGCPDERRAAFMPK